MLPGAQPYPVAHPPTDLDPVGAQTKRHDDGPQVSHRNDLGRDVISAESARIDDRVGLSVRVRAQGQDSPKIVERVIAKERAPSPSTHALGKDDRIRCQRNDDPISQKRLPRLLIDDRATAERHHADIARQGRKRFLLESSEGPFAALLEDLGNGSACDSFDLGIQVERASPQLLGHRTSHERLPGPHGP
jgi:hypothetical protein